MVSIYLVLQWSESWIDILSFVEGKNKHVRPNAGEKKNDACIGQLGS